MRVHSNARWLGGGIATDLEDGVLLDMPEPRVLFRRLMAQESG